MLTAENQLAVQRRALHRQAIDVVHDPECMSPGDRARLEYRLDEWLDEWTAELTDDQLTPEELEAQRRGSWSARVYPAGA